MFIKVEQDELERIMDALNYAADGAAEEMKYCSDPELSESLQKAIEAAEQIINGLAEQKKNPAEPTVAVKVSGGLVQAVYSDAAVNVEVYDLDVSDFPGERDFIEHEAAAEQLEKIAADPAFGCVW